MNSTAGCATCTACTVKQRLQNAPQYTATHRGLSVCLLVRIRNPGKMAEWIRMQLGWWLWWGLIVEEEGAFFGGESLGLSIVTNGIVSVRGDDAARSSQIRPTLGFFLFIFEFAVLLRISVFYSTFSGNLKG